MVNASDYVVGRTFKVTDFYNELEIESLRREQVDLEREEIRGTKEDVRRQIDELIAESEAKHLAFSKNLNIAFSCAFAKMSDLKYNRTDDAIDEMEEDRRWAIEELKKYNIYVKE